MKRYPMLKTYWHISDKDLGDSIELTPKNIPFESGYTNVARVCVAPSISQCLKAIGGIRGNHGQVFFWAYKIVIDSENPALDVDTPRKAVPDWVETHEAWILKPLKFQRAGTVERIQWGFVGAHGQSEPKYRLLTGKIHPILIKIKYAWRKFYDWI